MTLLIKDIAKYYGGIVALDNISLNIKKGEIIALVGDNGAGKSTLAQCISGACKPDKGNITFNENPLTGGCSKTSRDAGIEMVYQDLNLCGQQDIITNVFLGCEKRKGIFLDKQNMESICKKTFETLGIDIPLNRKAGTLSGGQQQSIAIARAMISNPKLLILDEPTAALAVKEVQKILNHIKHLKNQGISVIIITHRLGDIFEVADRILVMHHGKITYDIPPEQTNLNDLISKIIGS